MLPGLACERYRDPSYHETTVGIASEGHGGHEVPDLAGPEVRL